MHMLALTMLILKSHLRLHRQVDKVPLSPRLDKHIPNRLLGEAMMPHAMTSGMIRTLLMRHKVQHEQHTARVQSLHQPLRSKHTIIKVVKTSPHSRGIEAVELCAGKRLRRRVREQIAQIGGAVGHVGHFGIIRPDHLLGDVHADALREVVAEGLRDYVNLIVCCVL